jgi:hypothetical protein
VSTCVARMSYLTLLTRGRLSYHRLPGRHNHGGRHVSVQCPVQVLFVKGVVLHLADVIGVSFGVWLNLCTGGGEDRKPVGEVEPGHRSGARSTQPRGSTHVCAR